MLDLNFTGCRGHRRRHIKENTVGGAEDGAAVGQGRPRQDSLIWRRGRTGRRGHRLRHLEAADPVGRAQDGAAAIGQVSDFGLKSEI